MKKLYAGITLAALAPMRPGKPAPVPVKPPPKPKPKAKPSKRRK